MSKAKVSCALTKDFHEFHLPNHLVEEFYAGRVVLFAGAGISTENPLVYPSTLYEIIRDELNIKKEFSFSELMSRFCARPNGRIKLIERIQKRFQYIETFPELYKLLERK